MAEPAAEPPPPWLAVPGMEAWDPATQGLAEAYVVLTFLPFWRALTLREKAGYLDRWDASSDWRNAIATLYDGEGIDWEEEARAAAAWAATPPPPRRRWFRSRG